MTKETLDEVFTVVSELDYLDSSSLEHMFHYKLKHLQEFANESKDITKDYKMEQLGASIQNIRNLIKQDTAKRRVIID